LDKLVPKTDTLYLTNKISREKRQQLAQQEAEKKEKERKKQEKRGKKVESEKTKFLEMKVDAPSSFDIYKNIRLSFEEPVASIDTSAIHVEIKEDTLWKEAPFLLMEDSVMPRQYEILAEWEPEKEYRLKIDSAAITGLYGLHTNKVEQTMKVKKQDEYGTLLLNLVGTGKGAIVELLDNSGKVLRTQPVNEDGMADFYYLNPNTKYYIRLFIDRNGNGKWDTGDYENGIQPERVVYYHHSLDLRALFEYSHDDWNISLPLNEQKPLEITKQKPEKERRKVNRNATRNFK
jgi:hypothetical protein